MMALFWFLAGMFYVYLGLMILNRCKARIFMPIDGWIGRSLWRGVVVISGWVVVIPLTWFVRR